MTEDPELLDDELRAPDLHAVLNAVSEAGAAAGRLVVISGGPNTGKSKMATHVASQLMRSLRCGVVKCDLATSEMSPVLTAVCRLPSTCGVIVVDDGMADSRVPDLVWRLMGQGRCVVMTWPDAVHLPKMLKFYAHLRLGMGRDASGHSARVIKNTFSAFQGFTLPVDLAALS